MTTYGDPRCPVCSGAGGWEDPVAQQTVLCYLCRSEAYSPALQPQLSPLLENMQFCRCRYFGPKLPVMPWLLVVHSGAGGGDIERFFSETGYVIRQSDGRKIKVSAHLNYSVRHRGMTQGVPLDHVGWHCGGSRISKKKLLKLVGGLSVFSTGIVRKLNFCSWSIELHGPAGRTFAPSEHDEVVSLARKLRAMNPDLVVATRHQDIDRNKCDPGDGFDVSCLQDAGMVIYR